MRPRIFAAFRLVLYAAHGYYTDTPATAFDPNGMTPVHPWGWRGLNCVEGPQRR